MPMRAMTAARSAETLVHDLFQVIDGRSWSDLSTVFADDAVYERPGYEPLEGLERIRRFYEHERIIAAGEHQVEYVAGDLGAAACWGHFQGTSHAGETLDEAFADTYLVGRGKIVHRKTFFWRPAI